MAVHISVQPQRNDITSRFAIPLLQVDAYEHKAIYLREVSHRIEKQLTALTHTDVDSTRLLAMVL
jgi:hypothetical protein